jgi:predicted TIM-barrel fold metal-dependent hydrolase
VRPPKGEEIDVNSRTAYPVVDADQHVILPSGWWGPYLPARYADWMPRLVEQGGQRVLHGEGRIIEPPVATIMGVSTPERMFGAASTQTATPGSWRSDPVHSTALELLEQARTTAAGRLLAMDHEGLTRAMLFPSQVLGFLPSIHSSAFALAVARAYNDFVFDYASADPDRLFPVYMVPQQDMVLAAEEASRMAARGARAVMLRPNTVAGMNVDHPQYDRLWSVCEEAKLAVCFHEGIGVAKIPRVGVERCTSMLQAHMCSHSMEAMVACMLVITSGVLERFPGLRVAFLESDPGWVPFWLARMDDHVEHFASDHPVRLELRPTELFRRQCYVGIHPNDTMLRGLLDYGYAETLVFTTDFPHYDASYPGAVDDFLAKGVAEADARRILGTNGEKLLGLPTPL